MKRSTALALLASAAMLTVTPMAFAQGWPARAIHIVVPYPPGGSSDLIARLLTDSMSKTLGQPVVIDNKPGAAGQVASAFVARAEPDGYTLLATNLGPAAVAWALNPKLPYHPINDFTPVARTASMPLMLAAGTQGPISTVGELIAAARAQPGRLNNGTTGNGSLSHVVGELFHSMAGIKLTAVPYKGGAEMATAAVTGDVAYFIATPLDIMGLARAGKLRPLAITTAARSPLLPDVPTVAEAGLTGFTVDYWNGIMAPARTPPAVVEALNRAIGIALELPDVRAKLAGVQMLPAFTSPAAFGTLVQAEVGKWTRVVQNAGIKAD